MGSISCLSFDPGADPIFAADASASDLPSRLRYPCSRRRIVPNDAFSKVTEYLDNDRNVREALNEICAINTELLRRREDLD
jgi:hypothetical protein